MTRLEEILEKIEEEKAKRERDREASKERILKEKWEELKNKIIEIVILEEEIEALQRKVASLREEVEPYCQILADVKKPRTKATFQYIDPEGEVVININYKTLPPRIKKGRAQEIAKLLLRALGEKAVDFLSVSWGAVKKAMELGLIEEEEIKEYIEPPTQISSVSFEISPTAREKWQKEKEEKELEEIPF